MTGQPQSRPNCMWCGKPLLKHTQTLWFRDPTTDQGILGSHEVRAAPTTREEAQRHTNFQVLSVQRWQGRVHRAGVWDGVSYGLYGQSLFCTGGCAQAYGIAAAKRVRASEDRR